MLYVERIECTEMDKSRFCSVQLLTSEGGVLNTKLHVEELRNFDQFQKSVVRQTGLWIHHACESGRSSDRLAWRRMVQNALDAFLQSIEC